MIRIMLAAALAVSTAAFADLVVSDEYVCNELKAGAACNGAHGEGTCQQTTCGRNDYSGGIPPKRKSVPCLKCLPAPAKDAGAAAVKVEPPADHGARPAPASGTAEKAPAPPTPAAEHGAQAPAATTTTTAPAAKPPAAPTPGAAPIVKPSPPKPATALEPTAKVPPPPTAPAPQTAPRKPAPAAKGPVKAPDAGVKTTGAP